MSLDIHSVSHAASVPEPAVYDRLDEGGANRGERVVTIAGTSIAVLVVAAIAVLMGMA